MNIPTFPDVLSLEPSYPALLLDAYGVFYGGQASGPYPGSAKKLETLMNSGKKIGILSNTTQLSHSVMEKLEKQGIRQGSHYHFYITSGTVCQKALMERSLPFPTPKLRYILFGKPHPHVRYHEALFKSSPYTETTDPQNADFIYISVPHIQGEDQENPELFHNEVERACALNLPFLCANPDLFAHEGNPPRPVARQGSIAKIAIELGAKVYFFGKPHREVYRAAMEAFNRIGVSDPRSILMVGDTPWTDIRGGKEAMMATALVTGTGIFHETVARLGLEASIAQLGPYDRPHYLIKEL
ncbi:TIGR01459 family HAD-type hydrolase [Estrella lausannensis]|uniref:HAD-superfamily hydrolase n=1 Tax=Estrella lausannensis TaxID=483423 RepID=A0A0H5DRM3_9BACT|nr:TIGR01459 family HAD-type hydrolase [Estrella lausannensis]CRX39356.1 HAD-superfamily hydrolase [Estrella lausannensis]